MSKRTIKIASLSIAALSLLAVAGFYFKFSQDFFHGWQLWRPTLYVFMASVSWFALTLTDRRWLRAIVWIAASAALIGALTQFLHTPANSLLGMKAGYMKDYETNYYAAEELYEHSGQVYGIEEKYGLENPSVSFPFPTYYYYYASSLWGRLDARNAAGLFVLLTIVALWANIWSSLQLAGGTKLLKGETILPLGLFLILTTPAISSISMGQASLLASAEVLLGITLVYRKRGGWWLAAGLLIWALGVMTKPNFVLTWFIFAGVAWQNYRNENSGAEKLLKTSLFAAVLAPIAILLWMGGTAAIPGGVSVETYRAFLTDIFPQLGQRVYWYWNASPVQGLMRLTGGAISSSVYSVLLIVLYAALGFWKRRGAAFWLPLALLASAVVWNHYMGLVLPLVLSLFLLALRKGDLLAVGVALLSAALLNTILFPAPAIGLLLLAWMSYRYDALEGISGRID